MRPHRVCGRPVLQQLSLQQQAARAQLRRRNAAVCEAQQNLQRRAGASQDPSATATGRPYIGPHARAHMPSSSHPDHATRCTGKSGQPRPACIEPGADVPR